MVILNIMNHVMKRFLYIGNTECLDQSGGIQGQ